MELNSLAAEIKFGRPQRAQPKCVRISVHTGTLAAQVRPARKEDMPGIRALVRLFPHQLVQKDLPRVASFFVATTGDKVVGCCALQIYSKRIAEVRSLAVHPDFHDRGIASKLVEACKHRAAGRGIRELFAVTSQIPFFEKLGFATFRREKTAMFFDLLSISSKK